MVVHCRGVVGDCVLRSVASSSDTGTEGAVFTYFGNRRPMQALLLKDQRSLCFIQKSRIDGHGAYACNPTPFSRIIGRTELFDGME